MFHSLTLMEHELAKRGLSRSALCRRAGIALTTWTRWKSGKTQPQMRVWDRVQRHYGAMIAQHDEKQQKRSTTP